MANVLNCDIGVYEFKRQSCYEVLFRKNTFGKYKPFYAHSYCFNSTTTIFLFNGGTSQADVKFLLQSNKRGSLNKFPDFFRMGTLLIVHKWNSSPLRSNLLSLHRSKTFWKAPWKSSCVIVSMTFVTASFISSIVSKWLVHCPGGNATDPIWRVLASSDGISSWTPLKPQHSYPNPNPLVNELCCIDFVITPTPLIIPHRLSAFLESLMPLWCSVHARWSKSILKYSIPFCGIFSKFKTEFYCISFF